MDNNFFQKIFFGSPGTGKSYKVSNEIVKNLDDENIIHTIFHPEYKYGDFMGKLLPHTENGNITYKYYTGAFMKALAKAYQNILDNILAKKDNPEHNDNPNNVFLIIDEINRGNSSAIFGSVFQLLDRDDNGCSSYAINISDLEFEALLDEIGFVKEETIVNNIKKIDYKYEELNLNDIECSNDIKCSNDTECSNDIKCCLKNKKIKIPSNLFIVATMNTSDESIFYMDSAFKRRWDWEYVPVDGNIAKFGGEMDEKQWEKFRKNLNEFIKNNSNYIRKVEDKLIGKYFIKKPITYEKLQNKLLFFLWDSVFQRDKSPLEKLLGDGDTKLLTFGDFANKLDKFVQKILKEDNQTNTNEENKQ